MAVPTACQTFLPLLSPFIDGELLPAERVTVERHLAACRDCTGRVADLRAESGLIRVGMELAADEVDFSQFSQQVMAKLTPYKPPLWERLRVSLSEMFTYQRGLLMGGMAGAMAAVIAVVAVPAMLRDTTPRGYASQKLSVETVSTDADAHVQPMMIKADNGDAIIWLVDHANKPDASVPDTSAVGAPTSPQPVAPGMDEESDEEEAAPATSTPAAKPAAPGKKAGAAPAAPERRNGAEL